MIIPDAVTQLLQIDIVQLIVALLLTLPIAYNREQATRIMGLRTFPLVGLATCGFVLIGQSFPGTSGDAQARIVQGIVAGIGFIGGGAILKKDDRVMGTASAASIWTTGAIGVAVAYDRYDIAVFLAVTNFIILHWVTAIKNHIHGDDENWHESEIEADNVV